MQKLRTVKINVQDTKVLRKRANLPEWLNGTPILIDDQEGRPLRGMQAYRYLQDLVQQEESQAHTRTNTVARKAVSSVAPTRIDPEVTRQPSASVRQRSAAPPQPPSTEPYDENDHEEEEDMPQDATAYGHAAERSYSNDKVTDDDLQRFMQQRNASPASATPSPQQ